MMNKELLLKGFEVELFTGLSSGQHVGVSASVATDLLGFVKEPDNRLIKHINEYVQSNNELYKQYFKYGFYKIRVFQKRSGYASFRHLIPLFFQFEERLYLYLH